VAWSVLQSAAPASHSSGNVAATYGTNLSSGSKLIAFLQVSDGTANTNPSCTGISDGNSNNFTRIGPDLQSSVTGTYYQHTQIWVLDTPAGDVGTKPTITATLSGSANVYGDLLIQEVSGLQSGTSCLDGTAGTIAGSTASGDYSTGTPSYTSTASNEYLVSLYCDNGGSGARPTWAGPSGYTVDANAINTQLYGNVGVAYKNSTNGTETDGWAATYAGGLFPWGTVLVAFLLPTGTAYTRTGSLTVTPAFSVKKAEAHVQSMTVTPAFALVKAEAHKQSMTVTPAFSVTDIKNFGKGGTPDRHHRRSWNPR
jgi:hypothetical protein